LAQIFVYIKRLFIKKTSPFLKLLQNYYILEFLKQQFINKRA
jgi:hypothetical protein